MTKQGHFGPDNNNYITSSMAGILNIDNDGGHMDFSKEAKWEQAICIYKEEKNEFNEDEFFKWVEKGTYGRDLETWNNIPKGRYLISGWHKTKPNSSSLPWIQSYVQTTVNSNNGSVTFGFEDMADRDFNDITATYYKT